MNNDFMYYAGNGKTIRDRDVRLPDALKRVWNDDPADYIAGEGLRNAVNVALMLGQPLVITGEPGTGKTDLARSVAYELSLGEPLEFYTKSTSTAKDLFYRYDSLRHFHDAHIREQQLDAASYITFEALGLAILLSKRAEEANQYLPENLRNTGPRRSVVLVDEFDKAPRDLPNDILNEVERVSFDVHETGQRFTSDYALKPILIFTSNSEKNLPDAFLRRCVFYNIPFPDREHLKAIVLRRLGSNSNFSPDKLDAAIAHFEKIRALALKKKPATAELLGWLNVLNQNQVDLRAPGAAEAVRFTYAILAKNKEDKELMESMAVDIS